MSLRCRLEREISDIANAVREQADCIMLSGETTIGKYPVECVNTMNRIASCIEAEEDLDPARLRTDIVLRLPKSKMLRSAAQLAIDLDAAIVVFTRKGLFPQKLAALRPQIPIYAFTDQPTLFKQLLLLRASNHSLWIFTTIMKQLFKKPSVR